MRKIIQTILQASDSGSLTKIIFAGKRKKSLEYSKITLRPVTIRGEYMYQAEFHFEKKVTHQNIPYHEMIDYASQWICEDFKQINGELTQRLHDKSYLNAYTYYKIGRYKSAIVSLKNALKQFPDSNHREEIMYMIVDASYRFANNSVANKQTDRYLSMLDSYLSFKEEFPESKYTKEVDRMAKHARDYLDRNKKDEDKDNNI